MNKYLKNTLCDFLIDNDTNVADIILDYKYEIEHHEKTKKNCLDIRLINKQRQKYIKYVYNRSNVNYLGNETLIYNLLDGKMISLTESKNTFINHYNIMKTNNF
jgi:hypothetical protein